MAESDMRSRIVKAMKRVHAIPVENLVGPGTPDVNYAEGWIECKWLKSWPARPSTVVHVTRFHKGQRWWHFDRRMRGGQSWFALQVGREWLLFRGEVAAMFVGSLNLDELREKATHHSRSGLTAGFVSAILSEQPQFVPSREDYERLARHG